MTRPARALIDIPALRHNFQQVRKAAPGRKILAVVKADAYGHGAQRVARALDEADRENSEHKGKAEIIIGKQRNGPIGKVMLTFLGQHTRFENYIPDDFSGGYYS